jgi:predicted TIM-barrel fold metal-dependent hydrolase
LIGSIRNSEHIDKVCLFGVDSRRDRQGRENHRDGTVCAMTEDVLAVAEANPDLIIPFFSLNPLRPDALERIDEYVERGCRGAKFLQNYWGLDLNDEALIPYFGKLRDKGLPLIVHIGSEFSVPSYKEYEGADMLRLPLESGVTVIAAHMGLGLVNHGLRPWRNLSRNPEYYSADYFRILEMLETHDNLYADISAILAPLRARTLGHMAQQTQVHHKTLFGTDYPVPFTTRYNSYDIPVAKRKAIGQIDNPFDRYASVILEYFPEGSAIYNNWRKILNS